MPRFQDTEYKITRRLASELQELLVARFSCAMALAMFVRDKLGRGIVNEISRGNSVQPSCGELVSQCRRRACIGVLVEHLQAMGGSYALSQFIGYLCEAGYLNDTESGAFSDGEDNWSLERQRGFVRFEKGDPLPSPHPPGVGLHCPAYRIMSRELSAHDTVCRGIFLACRQYQAMCAVLRRRGAEAMLQHQTEVIVNEASVRKPYCDICAEARHHCGNNAASVRRNVSLNEGMELNCFSPSNL